MNTSLVGRIYHFRPKFEDYWEGDDDADQDWEDPELKGRRYNRLYTLHPVVVLKEVKKDADDTFKEEDPIPSVPICYDLTEFPENQVYNPPGGQGKIKDKNNTLQDIKIGPANTVSSLDKVKNTSRVLQGVRDKAANIILDRQSTQNTGRVLQELRNGVKGGADNVFGDRRSAPHAESDLGGGKQQANKAKSAQSGARNTQNVSNKPRSEAVATRRPEHYAKKSKDGVGGGRNDAVITRNGALGGDGTSRLNCSTRSLPTGGDNKLQPSPIHKTSVWKPASRPASPLPSTAPSTAPSSPASSPSTPSTLLSSPFSMPRSSPASSLASTPASSPISEDSCNKEDQSEPRRPSLERRDANIHKKKYGNVKLKDRVMIVNITSQLNTWVDRRVYLPVAAPDRTYEYPTEKRVFLTECEPWDDPSMPRDPDADYGLIAGWPSRFPHRHFQKDLWAEPSDETTEWSTIEDALRKYEARSGAPAHADGYLADEEPGHAVHGDDYYSDSDSDSDSNSDANSDSDSNSDGEPDPSYDCIAAHDQLPTRVSGHISARGASSATSSWLSNTPNNYPTETSEQGPDSHAAAVSSDPSCDSLNKHILAKSLGSSVNARDNQASADASDDSEVDLPPNSDEIWGKQLDDIDDLTDKEVELPRVESYVRIDSRTTIDSKELQPFHSENGSQFVLKQESLELLWQSVAECEREWRTPQDAVLHDIMVTTEEQIREIMAQQAAMEIKGASDAVARAVKRNVNAAISQRRAPYGDETDIDQILEGFSGQMSRMMADFREREKKWLAETYKKLHCEMFLVPTDKEKPFHRDKYLGKMLKRKAEEMDMGMGEGPSSLNKPIKSTLALKAIAEGKPPPSKKEEARAHRRARAARPCRAHSNPEVAKHQKAGPTVAHHPLASKNSKSSGAIAAQSQRPKATLNNQPPAKPRIQDKNWEQAPNWRANPQQRNGNSASTSGRQ